MGDGEKIKEKVRDFYGRVASNDSGCGCGPASGCCASAEDPKQIGKALGYREEELGRAAEEANLGLGCGNPQAIAELKPGETVLDLGCGAGFDCFLAAEKVGPEGRVIGVDMTPEMLAKARQIAEREGFSNVEFRLGEIENLPVADGTVDVIISNCVINLSADKPRVYQEAFRALKPGGRLAISDTVRLKEIPDSWREHSELHCMCLSGAASVEEVEAMLKEAGFEEISVAVKPESRELIKSWAPGSGAEEVIASAEIKAKKPG